MAVIVFRWNIFLEQKVRSFMHAEFFYPVIDQLYYSQNEFVDCLAGLGLQGVTSLSRKEWSRIRGVIGKPRRFSQNFLNVERDRLMLSRQHMRAIQDGRLFQSEFAPVAEEVIPRLKAGQRVMGMYERQHTGWCCC